MITSTWRPPDEQVVAFLQEVALLQEFERRGLDRGAGDDNQFADAFVATAPNGSTVLSRAALVASLPQRRRMFEAAGWAGPGASTQHNWTSTTITSW